MAPGVHLGSGSRWPFATSRVLQPDFARAPGGRAFDALSLIWNCPQTAGFCRLSGDWPPADPGPSTPKHSSIAQVVRSKRLMVASSSSQSVTNIGGIAFVAPDRDPVPQFFLAGGGKTPSSLSPPPEPWRSSTLIRQPQGSVYYLPL